MADLNITGSLQSAIATMSQLLNDKATLLDTEIFSQITNGPKPSYSIGNRSVSWDEWRSELQSEISALTKDIADLALTISKLNTFDLSQRAVIGNRYAGFI